MREGSAGSPDPNDALRRFVIGFAVAALGALLLCVIVQWARGTLAGTIWLLLWYINLVLRGFHQAIYWILFLCVGAAIAAISLLRGLHLGRAAPYTARPSPSRMQKLARSFEFADKGQYFKWSLAREMSLLLLEALGCDDRLESGQRRQWLNNPQLDIPPEIRAYVDTALWGSYAEQAAHRPRLRRGLGRARSDSPMDLDPAAVVQYLEQQLEVVDERGHA